RLPCPRTPRGSSAPARCFPRRRSARCRRLRRSRRRHLLRHRRPRRRPRSLRARHLRPPPRLLPADSVDSTHAWLDLPSLEVVPRRAWVMKTAVVFVLYIKNARLVATQLYLDDLEQAQVRGVDLDVRAVERP